MRKKKIRINKRMLAIAVIIIVVIGLIAMVFPEKFTELTSQKRSYCYTYTETSKPIESSLIKVIGEEDGKYIIKKCVGGFTFKYLPELPEDWWRVFCDFSRGRRDFQFYEEVGIDITNYYKQPEFYPKVPCRATLWDEDWHKFYIGLEEGSNVEVQYRGYGFGFYPHYIDIHATPGTVNAKTIIYASPSTWAYQGLRLEGQVVDKGTYRDEEITSTGKAEVKVTPTDLVLDPTQPYFYYDWAQMINIDITTEKPGTYLIYVSPGEIPPDLLRKYDIEYYGRTFTAPGLGGVTGATHMKILLVVE